MKKIYLILSLLAILFASCGSDSFKIDGTVENLDGTAVRVIFKADSGVVDEWVNLDKKGKFSFQGQSSQPIIVNLLNHRGDPLATLVAANGDHLKIKGDASKEMGLKVSGNRLNEEWQLFRDEHKGFYTDPNPSRLDAAIEKYVREHPKDMLSTVLLLADYSDHSDRDKVNQMLNSIDVKVRPESLTQTIAGNLSARKGLPRLMSLKLWKNKGGFEEISLVDRVSILAMWANPQTNREDWTSKVKSLRESFDGGINVIDILAESDTLHWQQNIAGEEWPHYWAPGGPMEQGINSLGINTMPWYAVTDSTGMVVYSGPNFSEASKKASDIIGK